MEIRPLDQLIRRMGREGDTVGWEEFVGRYGWRLECQVSSVLELSGVPPRREEVEELVQDIYCRLLEDHRRRLRSFRGRSPAQVTAFLNRTARNVVFDHLRAAQAAKRSGSPMSFEELDELLGEPADPEGSPEGRVVRRERWRQLLRRCVRRMGSRTARRDLRILRLALVEGWSSREIAASKIRELTPSAIDSVVCRARERLAAAGVRLPAR
jgi:RNA polymerase sigma factor (sigma-70 family)